MLLMNKAPFELEAEQKRQYMLESMVKLTLHHQQCCPLYGRYLKALGLSVSDSISLDHIPYLPARAFKELNLMSVDARKITKTVMSSGTSGSQSKIYIDNRTSLKQSRALIEILKSYLGTRKLPLLIVDSPGVTSNRSQYTARSAGAMGFSNLANTIEYALDDNHKVNREKVNQFLDQYGDEDFIIFGFTFVIWETLVQNPVSDLSRCMEFGHLFHGGGWKKLVDLGISDADFKRALNRLYGIRHVHNYYGMAEQTGSIFIECEFGKMHASKYSEILIRDERDLTVLPEGEKGVIQVLSTLPESYPGHSILTEDLGWVESDRLCECGRNGSSIHIDGRLRRAEIRGCSDAY